MLGHGLDEAAVEDAPGEESDLSTDAEESSAAWPLLRLVSGGQPRCLARRAGRYQLVSEKDDREIYMDSRERYTTLRRSKLTST